MRAHVHGILQVFACSCVRTYVLSVCMHARMNAWKDGWKLTHKALTAATDNPKPRAPFAIEQFRPVCFEGLPTPFSDNGTMHHVTIGGLQPNRSYEASQLGSVRILQHGGDSRIE